MAFLIRAPLSSAYDEDEDDDYSASPSSLSSVSGPDTPRSRSASPTPAASAAAPLRVVAQLTASTDDEDEAFDDAAADYEGDVTVEVSNGFFRAARVEQGPILDAAGYDTAVSASASESEYFGAVEGSWDGSFASARSVLDVFDAGEASARRGFEDVSDGNVGDKGPGIEGSLSGGFVPYNGALGMSVEGVSNPSCVTDTRGEDGGADIVANEVSEPFVNNAGGVDGSGVRVIGRLEWKDGMPEHYVVELPPAVDAGGEDAKDSACKHEVVPDVDQLLVIEVSSPEDVITSDGTFELEVETNADKPPSIANGITYDETNSDIVVSDDHATVTAFGNSNAVEFLGRELEDNAASTKHIHFGLDNLEDEQADDDDNEDEVEEDGKQVEVYDYAALAELLRAANRSPGEGNVKVFPLEIPASQQLSPPTISIPQTNVSTPPVLAVAANPENGMTDEEKKLYKKVDTIRIKYLRLVHRLGYNPKHQVATQVLYQLGLIEGFKHIRMASQSFELENAWKRASQLEADGTELEFSCNILVLGKTGVGKSATINSIFGEDKSKTNAFALATSSVKEIAGIVDGVKLRVIDTPGLGASLKDERSNRKVLNSVKKYIKKCPPDIVLYVDRVDTQRQDDNNLQLLRCITSVLGLPIWSKTIITLTHSAAAPPEGPSGSPMNYEMVVTHRTHALQQSIRQATDDPLVENPVALVENHPFCRTNIGGEKVLPNGLIWRPLLLLLCYSLKIVSEIDTLSKRRVASANLFGLHLRIPPLPYFLSSLLQSRVHPKLASDQIIENEDSDVDIDELLDRDREDEEADYDQLPLFKPLSKSQIAKLSKEQQRSYFDEYDYRIKLFQKKQWKEQLSRLKEIENSGGHNHDVLGDNGLPDDEDDTDKSPMPDWVLPSSFDSDDLAYRYRCLEPTPRLLVRAVTSPDGWDHDCGFDGVSLERSLDVANIFPASMWVQVNKDKREFTIHLDSSISVEHGKNGSTLAGFDIQTMMNQLAYTLRGETKFKNLKKNRTTGGLSVTFLGDTMVTGAKFEDKISVGKRLTLVANTGAVSLKKDTAFGVNMEACLRDKDYPIGQALTMLGVSLVWWHKELTMAANLKSQFSVGRSSNVSVHADLNSKLTGRVSIKASTSEQLKIALLGVCSTVMYLWNRMQSCADANHSSNS